MGLVADSAELSLLDLIQVKGLARATCRVVVNGRKGKGLLFLREGELVQASYAGLGGDEAAYALLVEQEVGYRVTGDVPAPAPDMRLGYQAAMLEAMRRLDEAEWRALSQEPAAAPSAEPPAEPRPEPAPAAAAPPASAPAARAPPSSAPAPRRFPTVLLSGLAAAAAVLLVGMGLLLFTRDFRVTVQSGPAAASAAEPREARAPEQDPAAGAVEVSALTGPGVSLPVLVSGAPPSSPDPALALKPTVICRLLVDRQGGVSRAEIFQRRPDLARFEEAALAAVRQYRFQPARRDGAPVPVWVNWPVDFI